MFLRFKNKEIRLSYEVTPSGEDSLSHSFIALVLSKDDQCTRFESSSVSKLYEDVSRHLELRKFPLVHALERWKYEKATTCEGKIDLLIEAYEKYLEDFLEHLEIIRLFESFQWWERSIDNGESLLAERSMFLTEQISSQQRDKVNVRHAHNRNAKREIRRQFKKEFFELDKKPGYPSRGDFVEVNYPIWVKKWGKSGDFVSKRTISDVWLANPNSWLDDPDLGVQPTM